jgi:hypothetical protein
MLSSGDTVFGKSTAKICKMSPKTSMFLLLRER